MERPAFHRTALGRFARIVNTSVTWIGQLTSLLVFVLIAILLYDVVMRYVVGRSTIWAGQLSGMLYAVYFLIGGAYALTHRGHVNVNILRQKLSPRIKAAVDLATWTLFYLFIGVIFWLGIDYARTSIERMETASTVWGPYIWPIKLFLPISAFLMLVVGFTKTMGDIHVLWTGIAQEEETEGSFGEQAPSGHAER